MEQNGYIENYFDALKKMRDAANKAIKEYGKELDVREECKKILVSKYGYNSTDEIDDDELNDLFAELSYSCFFTTKHGFIYEVTVAKVRYNEKHDCIDVFLVSDGGDICEWLPIYYVSYDEAVYMTILDIMGG